MKQQVNTRHQIISLLLLFLFILVGCHGHLQINDGPASLPEPEPTSDQTDSSNPDAPNLYQAPKELEVIRLSDTSVVLRWDLDDISMDHLQFFKIQYRSTKKNVQWKTEVKEIPPTSRAHQINALRPGNYFFVVAAVYDNDDNVPSVQLKYNLRAKSKITELEMPEKTAPIIGITETAHDYIRFKWKYNVKDRDMPTFGYLVYYRSSFSVEYTIHNAMIENVEIAELEPDTQYEAKVVAYNLVGISDFSETITLKTKPKQDISTSPSPSPSTSTTPSPIETITITISHDESTSTTPTPVIIETTTSPTQTINDTTTIANTYNKAPSFTNHLLSLLLTGQDDTTLAIRYSLFFLLPMIIITLILICLISFHRKRKSPSPLTNDSVDLEINDYFKNSFPGVEKECV